MAKYAQIKTRIHGGICRRCINKEFGLSLTPQDCIYYTQNRNGETIYLQRICPRCGQISHMLYSVRWSRRLKIWFPKKQKESE